VTLRRLGQVVTPDDYAPRRSTIEMECSWRREGLVSEHPAFSVWPVVAYAANRLFCGAPG